MEYAATLGLLGGNSSGLLAARSNGHCRTSPQAAAGRSVWQLKRTRLLEQGDAALSFYAIVRLAPLKLGTNSRPPPNPPPHDPEGTSK